METTMKRDCRVLESFKIMDYSLLVGVHNIDQAAKDAEEGQGETKTCAKERLMAHATAMESIQVGFLLHVVVMNSIDLLMFKLRNFNAGDQ